MVGEAARSVAVGRPWIVGDGNAATNAESIAVDELRRQLEELEASVDDHDELRAARRVLGLVNDLPEDGCERIRKLTTRRRLRDRRLPARIRGCSRSTSASCSA